LIAAFFILMVLFRALVPTVIPLLFAIVAVLGAFLLLFLAARLTHFNTVTEILVPMIGLGVGIDYTLFIVTRFRQFLHDGLSPQDAAAAAGATAGRAVIFAGVTVAISITGLALIGLDFITKLGIGSALGVVTAVLLANSLLPAVLSLLGQKIDRGRLGLRSVDESREGQATHAGRSVGPVRVGQREGRAAGRDRRSAAARLARARGSARPRRRRHGAEAADHAQGVRPALDRIRPRVHRADPGRDRHAVRSRGGDQARDGASQGAGALRSRQADLQQEEPRAGVGCDHQHLREVQAAGCEDRQTSSRTCGTR
jgi:hypothetical protein